jgi:hypothetical protein
LINVLLGIRRSYMITPKGVGRPDGPRLLSIYGPYFALTILPLAAVWGCILSGYSGPLCGYYGLALLNGVLGGLLLVTTLMMELRHVGAPGTRAAIHAAMSSVVGVVAISATVAWQPFLQAVA